MRDVDSVLHFVVGVGMIIVCLAVILAGIAVLTAPKAPSDTLTIREARQAIDECTRQDMRSVLVHDGIECRPHKDIGEGYVSD